MKKILTALALAALASSPALAKSHHMAAPASDEAYATAPGYYVAGPYAVVVDGQVVGADPDPTVRLDLLRQGNPAEVAGD